MFPENDLEFEVCVIKDVTKQSEGWTITRDDGWCFYVNEDSPIAPKVGMEARFYGKGLGFNIRGLFIDGVKVFYRTEEEQKIHQEIELYGADAQDWLNRWDANKSVWSISMGGFGPSYEQALQITVTEIVRYMLENAIDKSTLQDAEIWKSFISKVEKYSDSNPIIAKLDLSGNQYHAALKLAAMLYIEGPRWLMNNKELENRKIQIIKYFPSVY